MYRYSWTTQLKCRQSRVLRVCQIVVSSYKECITITINVWNKQIYIFISTLIFISLHSPLFSSINLSLLLCILCMNHHLFEIPQMPRPPLMCPNSLNTCECSTVLISIIFIKHTTLLVLFLCLFSSTLLFFLPYLYIFAQTSQCGTGVRQHRTSSQFVVIHDFLGLLGTFILITLVLFFQLSHNWQFGALFVS